MSHGAIYGIIGRCRTFRSVKSVKSVSHLRCFAMDGLCVLCAFAVHSYRWHWGHQTVVLPLILVSLSLFAHFGQGCPSLP